MGFFETLLLSSGVAATKGAASAAVKKASAIFWEQKLEPLLVARKAEKKAVNGLKKYVARLDKSTKRVTTVAAPGGAAALTDIYVPLTLIPQAFKGAVVLDRFPSQLIGSHKRILITDSAGMGKSTTLKFIVQSALISLEVFPILVELRNIKPDQSLLQYISEEVCGASSADACSVISNMLDGSVVLLLDGYDELDDAVRKRVNGEISSLALDREDCAIVVSSRPDSELKSLSGFEEFQLKRLLPPEAFQLIRNYDKDGVLAERLIEKIRGNHQIREFLGNPLMVSLLFKAYSYKNTIPFRRSIFFRQAYDALYQDHDLSKGGGFEREKKSALDVEDFHKALRSLGVVTYVLGRVQYEPERFHQHLESARGLLKGVTFDLGKLRADLLSAVPLFAKEGAEIRWTHKAFQEYFAAHYIYSDAASQFRRHLFAKILEVDNIRRHENLLLVLNDLDSELTRRLVVAPVFPSSAVSTRISACRG